MSPPLRILQERVAGCTNCSAARPPGLRVIGDGPLDAAIVLIGEAPGAEEETAGRPFVGPSGATLDAWLASAGILREQVRVLNALACRPVEAGARAGTIRNRPPTKPELRACRSIVLEQLALLKPVVIVTVGAPALHNFIVRGRMMEATAAWSNNYVKVDGSHEMRMRGMPPLPRPWIRLMSIWHPSGVSRMLREDKDRGAEAVAASVGRLSDARLFVEKYAPERAATGGKAVACG